jgi:ElaB/YqjD/DUF883 family membrane-anchored ribosome-binding protein
MTNSNFETMKRGGQAIDETAQQSGNQSGVYQQAKAVAGDAYDSAAGMAQDAISAVKARSSDLDDAFADQAEQHPKAMLALGIGFGFLLGVLFASTRGGRNSRW